MYYVQYCLMIGRPRLSGARAGEAALLIPLLLKFSNGTKWIPVPKDKSLFLRKQRYNLFFKFPNFLIKIFYEKFRKTHILENC